MRLPILILLLVSFIPRTFAEDAALTTTKLARHLGISTWRIPAEQLPASYTLKLYHVRGGTLAKEYLVGAFKNNGALLICARWLSDSVSVSMDDGTTIVSTRTFLPGKPVFTVGNKFAKIGSPLLICFVAPDSAKVAARHQPIPEVATTRDYSQAENGLAIVITASSP